MLKSSFFIALVGATALSGCMATDGERALGAARLARSFERDGLKTSALHGDMSQDERLKALDAFKRGEVDVLVATDVGARGQGHAHQPAGLKIKGPKKEYSWGDPKTFLFRPNSLI